MAHPHPNEGDRRSDPPRRVLVVCPSWVGDVVMATPALRRLRSALPGAWIGGLVRPGIDAVLAGEPARDGTGEPPLFDELHVERPRGMMGHKHTAAKLRARRYDASILLTNSFSTALSTRLAGIPRRLGYDRDGRGILLTHRLTAPKRPDARWAIVPAVDYYWHCVGAFLGEDTHDLEPANERGDHRLPGDAALELPLSDQDHTDADALLARIGVQSPFAILNPGGNNELKRWPADRFAEIGSWLTNKHGLAVLVNGSPPEAELCESIASACPGAVSLPGAGGTLGALKSLVARAAMMITNDTGPRHFAVAARTPVVTLFGPTDHRWTTVPAPGGEAVLVADPTLPADQSANDHAERCRVDRITTERVREAAFTLLSGRSPATG